MGVAAYDPNTLIKILKFLTFIRKSIRNKEARAIREKEKITIEARMRVLVGFWPFGLSLQPPGSTNLTKPTRASDKFEKLFEVLRI